MRSNVLVIGTGPVGPCLSLALTARGLEGDEVERRGATLQTKPGYNEREFALPRLRVGLDLLQPPLRGNEGRA